MDAKAESVPLPGALPKQARGGKNDPSVIGQQIAAVAAAQEKLRKKRPRVLSEDQKVDALMLYHSLQMDTLQHQQRNPHHKKKRGDYQAETARLLHYSTKTVARVYRDWKNDESTAAAVTPANRHRKRTRISDTKSVVIAVRQFIRERRLNKQRTVSRTVRDFLHEKGHMITNDDNKNDQQASLRATQRFLRRCGFRRGDSSGAVEEKPAVAEARAAYLARVYKNADSPAHSRLRLVDLDESYIHHHYRGRADSLYHPDDPQPRFAHKGQRYCFVAAIRGANPRVRVAKAQPNDLAGLVPGSAWIFKSQQASGDYHKNFNGKNFIHWFTTQLLPKLTEPSLIRLDNAKYHHVKPADTPKASRSIKKSDLQALLDVHGIPYDESDVVLMLHKRLRDHNASVDAAVVSAARALGHEVLFTPPYHCDLQPIEMLWARVKRAVGRDYDASTTMATVHTRLDAAFAEAAEDHAFVQGLYDHVSRVQQQYMRLDDDGDGHLAAESAASSSSSSSSMPLWPSSDDSDATYEADSDGSMSSEWSSHGTHSAFDESDPEEEEMDAL